MDYLRWFDFMINDNLKNLSVSFDLKTLAPYIFAHHCWYIVQLSDRANASTIGCDLQFTMDNKHK